MESTVYNERTIIKALTGLSVGQRGFNSLWVFGTENRIRNEERVYI